MNEVEMLCAARAILAHPGGWTRGQMFDGKRGYCAMGAIAAVQRALRMPWDCPSHLAAILALEGEANVLGTPRKYTVGTYNDSRQDVSEILDWFDRTIASLTPADTVRCTAIETSLSHESEGCVTAVPAVVGWDACAWQPERVKA
jgi:hypothetical protein